jgi:hypothetical protein
MYFQTGIYIFETDYDRVRDAGFLQNRRKEV